MSDPIVGIDLGTSNSVVAHADAAGHVKVLADDGGYKIHPSVVSFHPNGGVVVGAGAKQRKVIDPQNTIYSVKRLIGRAYESAEVQIAKRRVPYQIKEGPNRAPLIVTRGGEFAVPEISAIVLDHVRNIGSARLGTQVSRAVVTVPASFNDAQRSATATAGAIAGLTVVRVLNEPTAAALAYGHSRNLRQTIAVYDFGGGTFDITLLKLDDQVYEVLGTAGDTFLGGDDLDERLVDKMVAKFLAENRIDLRTNEVSMMRLRAVAEQTKIELSRRSRAVVRIDEIAYGPRGVPLNLQIEISRDEFVHEVADIIDRTFPVCQEALTIAGVGIHQIDDIILVGGTTKIPYVRDQVSKFFTKAPRTDVNPEDAVAIGAALQAVSLERVLSKPRTGRLAAQKQFPEDEDTLNRSTGSTNTSIDLVDTGGQAVVMQPPEVSPPSVPRPKRSTATYDEREVQLPDTSYRVTRGNVRDVVDKSNERPITRPPEDETTAPNPPIVIPPASTALPPPPTDDTSYKLTRSGQKDTYTEKAKKDPLAPTSGEITRPGAPAPNLDDLLAPKGAADEMGLAPVSAKQEMGLAPKPIGRMSRPVATPPPLPTAPAGPQGKQTLFGVAPGPDPKRPDPKQPADVGNTTDVIRSLQADQTTTHGPRPTPPADSQPTLPRHAPPRAFTDSDDFTDEGDAFRTPLPSGLTPLPSTTAPMSPVAPIAPATAPTLVALAPDFAAEVDSVTAASTNKLIEQQAAASSTAKGMGPVNTLNLPPPTGMHPATTAKGFPPPQAQPPDPRLAPPMLPVAPVPVALPPPPSPFIPQQPPPRLPPAPLPLAPPPVAPPNAQTLYVPPPPAPFQAPAAPPFQAASAPAPLVLDLPGWPAQAPGWPEQPPVAPPPPQGQRPAPVLLEVTPRGLGIATVAGYCEELIRRNSRLPTEMKKLFTTSRDRQDIVRIVVCQGESRRMDKNVVIGDLVLQGLPPRPRGETSIEVTFFVDASGVLQVSARDALTGNEQRASLDLVGGMQDVAASRERIQRLRSDAS